MTSVRAFISLLIPAVVLCGFAQAVWSADQDAGEIALEKSDFAVFGGNYEAYLESGFKPRRDVEAVQIAPPIDWDMDPFDDRNWRFQLSAWRMLNPIWSHLYDKDWSRVSTEIMPWLVDWHRYHVEEGQESDFEWYDMAAGLRAQNLALVLWLPREGKVDLSSTHIDVAKELADLHIQKLLDESFISRGNHGIFQVHGLRVLCEAYDSEHCKGEREYTARLMQGLLKSQFDEHGVHVENSPFYHNFALRRFSRIRPALYPAIRSSFENILPKAEAIAPWFTLPDGSLVNVGDSEGQGVPFKLDSSGCKLQVGPSGCVLVKDLTASGYAIVRSPVDGAGKSMLFVAGAAASAGHDHADQLSFVLYEGRRIFVDSGKYTYEDDKWRHYFIGTDAHNTASLEGVNFLPKDTVRTGSALSDVSCSSEGCIVTGSIARRHGRMTFRHTRQSTYQPQQLLEVQDRVFSNTSRRVQVAWHLAADLEAGLVDSGISIMDGEVAIAQVSVFPDSCKSEIIAGRAGARPQGWVSRSYHRKESASVIVFTCPADVSEITTRVELSPSD